MRVIRANTYSVPIFAIGINHWNILIADAEPKQLPFCSVTFNDVDPKHPQFAAYMQGVQERVEHVVTVLNAGFEAMEKAK